MIFCFTSFLKGDMFIVHNELDDGWMWVTNVRTEEQGLIVEDRSRLYCKPLTKLSYIMDLSKRL